jgi:phosphatidylethanolamine/phosphatidyl-N-methylethanolamine N-methyltransferase
MRMTNMWNQFIYRLWAPIYDATVNRFFMPGRRHAIDVLAVRRGERVLIVGVGTGADLPLLPEGIFVTGIDLSPEMLSKAQNKLSNFRATIELILGDAQTLLVAANSYDVVILNLILSVVPNGRACFQSTLRALKPGGRIVVFDKFQSGNKKPSPLRTLLNLFSTLFGTDITRSFEQISDGCPCVVERNEPSLLNGMYRVIVLHKLGARPKTETANKTW